MHQVQAVKYTLGERHLVDDTLTIEEMLSISINGEPYTMTMRTPGYEEELTRGILLSEDVYDGIENPTFLVTEKNDHGYITKVNVVLKPEQLGKGILSKRNLLSVTSCGMCGKYETDLALNGERLETSADLSFEQVSSFFIQMKKAQENFQHTGGSHAAAAFSAEGKLLVCREDIGRHNAVDKVIGFLMLRQLQQQAVCLIVSGRVSYEIVSKCYRARIPYLAAVSAPSSMAVEYCKDKGIQLYAFCREDRATKYS
ncbi:MAG: formate dehydrogenase accessory sulfurtransferase FdhD [Chitinophagaceae bacterium]|nr:formate dehydrogenase accessory sulfurtransferase FdhD [Chitinophagaceae bacterium]